MVVVAVVVTVHLSGVVFVVAYDFDSVKCPHGILVPF